VADRTSNAPLRFADGDVKVSWETLDSSAAQHVYRGEPMIIDVSEDTVNLRHYIDATVLVTATDVFIGFALEEKVVALGDTEAGTKIQVATSGRIGIQTAAFTNADRGKTIMMTDSGVLAAGVAAAGQLQIGKLDYVEDGYAYIVFNTDGPTIQVF
jgi:hypothetical protein